MNNINSPSALHRRKRQDYKTVIANKDKSMTKEPNGDGFITKLKIS